MNFKQLLKKTWHFIWYSNSPASWVVNIILAFIIVKFIVYPVFGLVLVTSHPLVAVVSSSMEHQGSFDDWWDSHGQWYLDNDISKEEVETWQLSNGFNKGDIMILFGKESKDLKVGDVVVFQSNQPDPIIHRIVKINDNTFQTKGDNNVDSIKSLGEFNIKENQIIGKAILRVPLLGWIKIIFTSIINLK